MYRKILNYKHIFDIRRKEEGFDFLPDLIAISCVKEKASVSASVTVEAVLCVPLFLYAAVSLIWMLELRSIQSAVRCGLQSAGKQVAESFAEIPVLNPISLHFLERAMQYFWLVLQQMKADVQERLRLPGLLV